LILKFAKVFLRLLYARSLFHRKTYKKLYQYLARLTNPASRICPLPLSIFLRTTRTLIFNYLIPTVRFTTTLGWNFTRSQVLPRVVAATSALIRPPLPPSCSQQRDIIVIIILPVPPAPTTTNVGPSSTPQADDDVIHPAPVPPDSSLANIGPPSLF